MSHDKTLWNPTFHMFASCFGDQLVAFFMTKDPEGLLKIIFLSFALIISERPTLSSFLQ